MLVHKNNCANTDSGVPLSCVRSTAQPCATQGIGSTSPAISTKILNQKVMMVLLDMSLAVEVSDRLYKLNKSCFRQCFRHLRLCLQHLRRRLRHFRPHFRPKVENMVGKYRKPFPFRMQHVCESRPFPSRVHPETLRRPIAPH
jgi:hypothetical protein